MPNHGVASYFRGWKSRVPILAGESRNVALSQMVGWSHIPRSPSGIRESKIFTENCPNCSNLLSRAQRFSHWPSRGALMADLAGAVNSDSEQELCQVL